MVAVWQWGATPDALLRGDHARHVAGRRRLAGRAPAPRRRGTGSRARAAAERADLRLTLARELHDTVAGDVAAIGIQAAAARRVIATQPAEAAAALERIEVASRAANADLRRMLEALRSDDGDVARRGARAWPPCRRLAEEQTLGRAGRDRR